MPRACRLHGRDQAFWQARRALIERIARVADPG